MKEELISFETAVLAKEVGFGLGEDDYIELYTVYQSDGSLYNNGEFEVSIGRKYPNTRGHLGADTIDDFEGHLFTIDNSIDEYVLAPTQSLLQKQLREIHDIHIVIQTGIGENIWWSFQLIEISTNDILLNYEGSFNTFEEALEVALYSALKLIKL